MTKKWAIFFLFAVIAVTVLFGLTLPNTKFDYDFDKFFKPDDEPTQYFNEHRETFGTDNDFILIGVVNNGGVFDEVFLSEIEKLTAEVKEMPYVKDVISPSTLKNYVREPLTGAIFQTPVIRGDREKDSIRVFTDQSLVDNIFSENAPAISLVVITEPRLSKNKSDVIFTALKSTIQKYKFDDVHLAGRAIGQVVYVNKIQTEFSLFMGIALIFIVILLFVIIVRRHIIIRLYQSIFITICFFWL